MGTQVKLHETEPVVAEFACDITWALFSKNGVFVFVMWFWWLDVSKLLLPHKKCYSPTKSIVKAHFENSDS